MGFGSKVRPDHAILSAWSNLTASRAADGTGYTNNSGGVRAVWVQVDYPATLVRPSLEAQLPDATTAPSPQYGTNATESQSLTLFFLVPIGETYSVTATPAGFNLQRWWEANFS